MTAISESKLLQESGSRARAGGAVGYALLILVTMIWGSTFLITRAAVLHSHPFTFLSLRFCIAAGLLIVMFNRRLRSVTRSELTQGIAIGVILFLSLAFQTVGARFTTATKAGFLVGLSIPSVPLLALPILRQLPGRRALLGVLISFIGLSLISMNGRMNLHLGTGEWLMVGAALTAGLHIVVTGKYAPGADAINLAVIQIATTAALSLMLLVARHEPRCAPEPAVVAAAGLMGLFATAFALIVMARVQQSVSSTNAALIYALEPVWAGWFGLLAGETLRTTAWFGCGLILLGIIVGTIKRRVD